MCQHPRRHEGLPGRNSSFALSLFSRSDLYRLLCPLIGMWICPFVVTASSQGASCSSSKHVLFVANSLFLPGLVLRFPLGPSSTLCKTANEFGQQEQTRERAGLPVPHLPQSQSQGERTRQQGPHARQVPPLYSARQRGGDPRGIARNIGGAEELGSF